MIVDSETDLSVVDTDRWNVCGGFMYTVVGVSSNERSREISATEKSITKTSNVSMVSVMDVNGAPHMIDTGDHNITWGAKSLPLPLSRHGVTSARRPVLNSNPRKLYNNLHP
jgi:hypothetical protein